MSKAEIESQLRDFIEAEFPNPGAALETNTNLLEDWFVDSFAIVNTILFIETQFGVEVARADVNPSHFQSIQTLASFVEGRLQANAG